MKKLFKQLFVLFILLIFSTLTFAQDVSDTVDIFDLSLEELLNIKVYTAAKKSQEISQAPAIIEIITEDEIREKGFLTVGDALKSIPGLFVTTDYVTDNVSIRGINEGRQASSRGIKVMINGQPISFRPTSENFLGSELIPITMVKQIEIIRGPASTLYGANAFLGVINIITKEVKYVHQTSLTYGNGILSGNNYEFTTGINLSKVDFSFALCSKREDRKGLQLPISTDNLLLKIENEYPGYNLNKKNKFRYIESDVVVRKFKF